MARRSGWAGLLGLVMLFGIGLQAQVPPAADGFGKGAGPRLGPITVLEVSLPDRGSLDRLVRSGYDVARVRGNQARVYADSDEVAALRAAGWALSVVQPQAGPVGGPGKALGSYHNYASLTTVLNTYAATYQPICRKVSLGKSVQNRDLWAMKISSDPDVEEDKPDFRYVATVHGNEPVGTEMCLYFIDLLLKGYGSNDTRIVNLVNNAAIWIMPLMNPDGREAIPPQRYNANGYDLNRNFPEGSGLNFGNRLYGPSMNTNGLQPETRQIMSWTAARHFVMSAHYHTGSLVVNYPYDNDGMGSVFSPSPDEGLFQVISRTYASNNLPMWNNNDPFNHFTNGVVNGADWYAVSGGVQDWSYRYQGSLDVTIELSDYQWPDPPATELPTYWSQNRESMLAYLEWSLRGVRGRLRDAQTGAPVQGAVRVEGAHHLVFSGAGAGDYHRVLLPGTYHLWFYAPGYVPQQASNVVVGLGPATRLDVWMQPASSRFAAKINFQPAGAVLPAGYLADSGAVYGARAGGYTYGWETSLASGNLLTRNAGRSQDLRYDTFCQMQAGANHTWAIAVPNGPYSVLAALGDPQATTGTYRLLAEGLPLTAGSPSSADRWVEGLGTVIVTDGRLTLTSAAGAVSNRLAFVEISAVDPTTLAQWRALYFGTTANAGNAADNADPDGDGLPNLLEYAFGFNPTIPDAGGRLQPYLSVTNSAVWPAFSFFRNTNATDLTFLVQGAGILSTQVVWSTMASFVRGGGWSGPASVTETPASATQARVTVRDSQPLALTTNRFFRLLVAPSP